MIYHRNTTIDRILDAYAKMIGADLHRYGNHVHRVYRNCIHQDADDVSQEKYAIASAFHDIGIWTHRTFDYINPSVTEASKYLRHIGRKDWIHEITAMIIWHHKITPYTGPWRGTVEVFRRADLIDLSFGLFHYGMDRRLLSLNRSLFPAHGFHLLLLKEFFLNLVRHPLHPLPMFRQ